MKNTSEIFQQTLMVHELKMLELKQKHKKELNEMMNKTSKQAIVMLLPILSSALHEVYSFGEEKQKPCIQKVLDNLREVIDQNIIDWDEYREYCEQKGRKVFVEVENDN